jgi:2-polyprenyl-3-methyl-5-hydroxy-6-metoxy-1,4-benzoquinol methylase
MKYSKLDNRYKRRSHNIFKDILQKYSKEQFPKILDVGCASGIMGMIKKLPKNVFGIERDEELIRLARDNCEKVYKIDLNNFKKDYMQESDFDFIFCGDILEHVLDPEGLLRELIGLLSQNAYIIISIPNIAQIPFRLKLLFGNFDRTETGVLDKTHLHLYTYKTAIKLIKSVGLHIVDFYSSGTVVSFLNILPKLLSSQLIFLFKKQGTCGGNL